MNRNPDTTPVPRANGHKGPENPSERYTRGLENLGRVDGHGGGDVLAAVEAISPDLAQYLVEFPFGDVYARPGLGLREREVSAITALATQSAWPQFKVHVRAGLRAGLTRNEILEIVIQTAVYCGFPTALNALFATGEVFADMEDGE
ncbi:carboxymuconolactone decarboxylase family protein [Oceanidesulfovibrio marinus]|uniref:Carboxymuconolactone decarboxylase family protein n=1 Tax=Oceanidesulfovibrio marinus TaxID=370038 RepID=A0A6P1ZEQ9_9BACT|nr:carboxymuconolactone decarboxylase family protein [Oceanidesulfovibrio marinus]QJT08437.1 carboxymuconolactone decarboxylase family protein [Oceanidesulfovibrio marinus]TVM33095.1 carboxymuconolactone decarboxylase family protein [Oceanidesulfovibrio marinus]